MIRSALTVSLVAELSGGPWVYRDPLEISIPQAKKIGFDGIELFVASAAGLNSGLLARLLRDNHLELSAIGTGAGKVLQNLTLTSPDKNIRTRAQSFIGQIIRLAGDFGAPAIIGSMQGAVPSAADRSQVLAWLAEGLEDLAGLAQSYDQPLLFEPLNRYETDIFNRLGDAAAFIGKLDASNILLVADLFHMNIEEASIPQALHSARKLLGYVHFADSNRRAVGMGHTAIDEIAETLRDISYSGYLSAEVFAIPNPDSAALQTIKSINTYFRRR